MKDYEDEAFDELEKKLQKQVAHGVTDGSLWRKRQEPEQDWKTPPKEDAPLVNWAKEQDVTIQSLKDLKRSICDEVGKAAFAQPEQPTPKWQGARFDSALHDQPPQPEQEPVAWMMPDGKTVDKWALQFYGGQVGKPLYTHPPQRKPLTDERLELIGHADLAINNIYIFNGYGEEVPEGRTPIYAGYKAAHGIKEKNT